MIQFEVECETTVGQKVCVVGSGPLGDWDGSKGLLLEPEPYPQWCGRVAAPPGGVEFKYVLVDASGPAPKILQWESEGQNRRADPAAQGAERLILHHVFGDYSRSSVEVVQETMEEETPRKATDASASTAALPSGAPPCATSSPAGSAGGDSRGKSPEAGDRVLNTLHVEASVRFGRFSHVAGAFEEKYELREKYVLGTGMSGGVCLAVARASGAQVAVKTLPTEGLAGDKLAQVIAEVENQLMMDHPNICRLLEVFEEEGRLRLVMERMRGPDLFEHLSRKGRYTERDAAVFVKQMAAAVAYCHRSGVCHRDLKLENFCLEDELEEARVKLIDFGLSSVIGTDAPMTNACGTLYYVAPEVLSQKYDKKCDLWSLGVLTYILLDGRPPFSGRDDRATYLLIKQGQFSFPSGRWSQISQQARDFVSALLQVDVSKRLDAEGALAHPWLAEFAVASAEELEPLDAGVLKSMRDFSKSNALKRAVLRAIAPVATAERVAGWAGHFEALDLDGDGKVAIKDLAARLVEHGGLSAAEAQELSGVLAEADVEGDLVSYSAFLAACLSAHVIFDDQQLRSLFDRLDVNKSGRVSVEDVCNTLGDLVGIEDLRAEFDGGELSYSEFRWLMSMPGHGPSVLGLAQLLKGGDSVESSWKVSTRRAKNTDDAEGMEAARRENMAWRVMYQQAQKGVVEPEEPSPKSVARPPQVALSLESMLIARGLRSRAELEGLSNEDKRSVVVQYLAERGLGEAADLQKKRDEELAEMCRLTGGLAKESSDSLGSDQLASDASAGVGLMARTPTLALIKCDGDTQEKWQCATAAAKEGDMEASRRENMMWRKMHMEHKKTSDSLPSCVPEV